MRNEVSVRRLLNGLIDGIFESGHAFVLDGGYFQEIGDFVEHTTTTSKSPEQLVRELCEPGVSDILDFGCGTAAYRKMLEGFGYRWTGLNYQEGMAKEAADLALADPSIKFYDGQVLPFPDHTFDVVYSFQTFEHIQKIDVTFSEIWRVLKPGGSLVGAVSQLEQIHDFSTFNFTPYGFKIACDRAGLKVIKLYPRFDVFTWMLRRLLIVTSASDENSLSETLKDNNEIAKSFVSYGERMGVGTKEINLMRLMFSSHFTFHVTRT